MYAVIAYTIEPNPVGTRVLLLDPPHKLEPAVVSAAAAAAADEFRCESQQTQYQVGGTVSTNPHSKYRFAVASSRSKIDCGDRAKDLLLVLWCRI